MGHFDEYRSWLEGDYIDQATKDELDLIKEIPEEIEDRFYRELEFGTAGLRGIIGAGTNRMNIYTVAKATQGLSKYLLKKYGNDVCVAIAFDSRHKSEEFAKKSAEVLAYNGIRTYIFDELRPTPVLSYAVRDLGCKAGIVITASHNPSKYNGYKVYNQYGGQILDEEAKEILEEISGITYESLAEIKNINYNNICTIGKEIDDKYINDLKSLSLCDDIDKNIRIVYSPLHGTGNKLVRRILKERGFEDVYVVKEQELPDPNFSTVNLPNPEDIESFRMGVDLAFEKDADIVLATDPDCDRIGIMIKNTDSVSYEALTGNEVGALILNYILTRKKEAGEDLSKLFVANTVVTSDLGEEIAKKMGVKVVKTLTGFKYIADEIRKHQENKSEKFVFGYEESYGYLVGDFARDKDAVVIAMFLAEMAAFYMLRNKTLLDVLNDIFIKYNYYMEKTSSFTLDGISGNNKIDKIIEFFRDNKPRVIAGLDVIKMIDYKLGIAFDFITGDFEKLDYPKSNVIKFCFKNGGWFVVRPSGTEPKLKIYFSFNEVTGEKAQKLLNMVENDVYAIMNRIA